MSSLQFSIGTFPGRRLAASEYRIFSLYIYLMKECLTRYNLQRTFIVSHRKQIPI